MGVKINVDSRAAVTNVQFSQTITIPNGSTFDGADSVNDPLSARIGGSGTNNYYGSWPWSKGFVVKPSADITTGLTVVMWEDYNMNEKRGCQTATDVDKTLTGSVWNEDLIIRITNNTGSPLTLEIGR
jgi:hypothetical protein